MRKRAGKKMPIHKLQNESNKEYHARWMREWRLANPDKRNDSQYKWRRNNPEKFKESYRKYKAKNPEYFRIKDREKQRRLNGLPLPTRPCPAVCEVCGKEEKKIHKNGTRFSLALDHCHSTGKFRGWLCSICNTVAGMMKDDYEIIFKLAEYLKPHATSGN